MKYKVGDKVRVRSDLEAGKGYGNDVFTKEMKEFKSKIVTIERVISDGYRIKEDYHKLSWTEEMFLLATFTKSDLKTGHVVEYRNGKRRMVVKAVLINGNGNASENLSSYTDDLKHECMAKSDICKVYEVNSNFCGDLDTLSPEAGNLNVIWEREEPPKKMTISEIEAALGHRVEVVAEVEQ